MKNLPISMRELQQLETDMLSTDLATFVREVEAITVPNLIKMAFIAHRLNNEQTSLRKILVNGILRRMRVASFEDMLVSLLRDYKD